jgi:hypothetical protein
MLSPQLIRNPWLALLLLGGEYAILGWYLGLHQIFWLIGISLLILTFVINCRNNQTLEPIIWFISQPLFLVLGISLLFSLVVVLIFIQPILLSLITLPIITLLYAVIEMQAAGFRQVTILVWLLLVTGFGLGMGEFIDLLIVPKMRL